MDNHDNSEASKLSGLILESLDSEAESSDMAKRAYRSRSSFFRLFQALIEESPGAMKRRLLLERAAWQLAYTRLSVTQVALEANYGSLEAFTRAFRKAFKTSPSLFRRSGSICIHLPAPNRFHFVPSQSRSKGAHHDMDLFEIFSGTDSWYTRRMLRQAATLTDEQLDKPMNGTTKIFGWEKPDRNLREMLERIVQTKEVWSAALTNGEVPPMDNRPAAERTPAAMLQRFDKAEAEFQRVLGDVRTRGAWSDTFVDELCEPAETFTYGGMFAHIITFNTYRRLAALDALHRLGVSMQGIGCPMEYEASVKESDLPAKVGK